MIDEVTRMLHGRVIYGGIVLGRGEGSVFRRLDALRAVEFGSPADLLARQRRRLNDVIRYAAARVPLYQDRWDGAEELANLPLLSKKDLQQYRGMLVARPGPRRVTTKTTGGSTGEAVTVIKDREATAAEMAATWLGYGWMGIRIGDRAARFWGAPTTSRRRIRSIGAGLAMRRISFSAFAFDEQDLERYWRRCLRFRPAYLYGYVSMLEAFGAYLDQVGRDGAELGLKAIVTTSEVLAPPQREFLTRVFGVPVQNEYGCGEVGPIAYSCERGTLHVMSENVIVEVLSDSGQPAAPGETGELVVTDLNNRAMPLVRYRVGDLGVQGAGPCACGRGFPTLEKVWGRAYDFVETPDGRRYHGEFFMYLFEDLRAAGVAVDQFQVAQVGSNQLVVKLATLPATGLAEPIKQAFAVRLPTMEVNVDFVEMIPRSRSGKLRLIENQVSRREPPL